ncbi:MAG TPA: 2'-5' RNA ligase family protein [Puia sp.]|nr:2'-5' RNA ligase family protein [Puia sp.]
METGLVETRGPFVAAMGRDRPLYAGHAEYLLVAYPNGDLQDMLLEVQQQFSAEYGLEHRLDQGQRISRNRPHITVASFRADEEVEETLIRWIRRVCQERTVFDLALNNYSGIPSHTIFIRVQDPEPLHEMMRQLGAVDEFIRSSGWPAIELPRRPHVSIAGGLTGQVYNKAMPDYSRKSFHGSFRVSELVLLRRRHAFDPCKTVNVFGLKN